MPIWVDADACPIPVKEILHRAAPPRPEVSSPPWWPIRGCGSPLPLHQDPAGGEGIRCGGSCHCPAGSARRFGDHRRHPPRLLGHRCRRRGAQSPWRDLHPRDHPGPARHAQLHGRAALGRGADSAARPPSTPPTNSASPMPSTNGCSRASSAMPLPGLPEGRLIHFPFRLIFS